MPLLNYKLSINTITLQTQKNKKNPCIFISWIAFLTDVPYHFKGDVILFLIYFQPDSGPQSLVSQPPSQPL